MKEIIIKIAKTASFILLAYLSAIAVVLVANMRITLINIIVPIIFIANIFLYKYFINNCSKKQFRYSLFFAIPFSLSLVLGGNIDLHEKTYQANILLNAVCFIILAIYSVVAIASLFNLLDKKNLKLKRNQLNEKKVRLVLFIVFFLAWSPYLLTYFPGLIHNDALSSFRQVVGSEVFNNHHPVFYTLFMKLIIGSAMNFVNITYAVGIYTIIHMLIFAFVLAYFVGWLVKKNANIVLIVITALYFAFAPSIAIYSIYITKDILFSIALLLFIMLIDQVIEKKGEVFNDNKFIIKMILTSCMMFLLRNNGIFTAIGTLIICIFIYKKVYKRILLMTVSILLLNTLITGPIFNMLDIKTSSFAESISIPLQQVARTIIDREEDIENGYMGDDTEEFLSTILDFETVRKSYNAGITDTYKFHEDFNDEFLNDNKLEFLKHWAKLLPDNLGSYCEAYLMQTCGYWHIGQTNSITSFGVKDNELGIKQIDFVKNISGISLESIFEKAILGVRKAPILLIITNMAGMMFMILIYAVRKAYIGKKTEILSTAPIWMLWGTLLVAAPASCVFRYLFILAIVMPYFIHKFLEE